MKRPWGVRHTPMRRQATRRWPLQGHWGLAFTSALAVASGSGTVVAQPSMNTALRVPEFGRAIASVEDSTAIVVNPANLAFMNGSEFRWTGVFMDEQSALPYNGHALGLGLKVPLLNAGAGVRLDMVYPQENIADVAVDDYKWLTWALALPLGPGAAIGASVQHSYSDGAVAHDLTSVSLGVTSRMSDWFALSFVGHDINQPSNRFFSYRPSYTAGMAVRPLSSRTLELAFESTTNRRDETWQPKVLLGLDLPPIGRLRSEFSVIDPRGGAARSWHAALSLSVNLNTPIASTELSGGVATGTTFGQEHLYSPYFSVATRSFREPVGAQVGRYAANVTLDEAPDARDHFALLQTLWSLEKDPLVDAVALTLRAPPGRSAAAVEELRDALFQLRRAGKRVVCHADSVSVGGLYLCAAANRLVLSPAGEVRVAGLHSEYVHLAELLARLGVKAEFVRAGDYKGAPEQLTQRQASAPTRESRINLLQQFEIEFTTALALGRQMEPAVVRKRIAAGPFLAEAALEQGFVDSVAFEDQLQDQVRQVTGRSTPLVDELRVPTTAQTWNRQGTLAVVHVEGELVDGTSADFPLLGVTATGAQTIRETLERLGRDRRVKAIVVRVDSPGGSSSASDALWRAVSLSAKRKPTVVSMGGVAASGGYYLASAGSRVFANATSVTGSIGVFYGKADVSGLLGKVGIDVESYKTHPSADADSWFRPSTEAERAAMKRQVDGLYELFLSRVSEARELSPERVRSAANGRVWTGRQALAHGLIDEVGGFRQALEYARQQAGLSDQATIIELPRRETSLLRYVFGMDQTSEWSQLSRLSVAPGVKRVLQDLAPLAIQPANSAQCRLELSIPELQ